MDYKSSGVDIDAGNETVRRIKGLARSTFTPGVLSEIGSFGGLSASATAWRDPVLVSSADGVGTKLKIAFMTGRHDTIGVDLVNHCVNDILVQGAVPLFFLDYLATGRLSPDVAEQIVKGLARGCQDNGCALLGGETAEMPGFYAEGEYDVAGFIVGAVERDASDRRQGHLRRRCPDRTAVLGAAHQRLLAGQADRVRWAEALRRQSRSRPWRDGRRSAAAPAPRRTCPVVKPLLGTGMVKGMAHITGGGITDNLPRVLPKGTAAVVDRRSWRTPALFRWLGESGSVPEMDLRRAFNMGIGLILVVAAETSPPSRRRC